MTTKIFKCLENPAPQPPFFPTALILLPGPNPALAQISQSASWRYAHHNSFTLLSSPEDTKLDLEAAHNLPIEPLFVSDMAMATHRVLGRNMTPQISTRIETFIFDSWILKKTIRVGKIFQLNPLIRNSLIHSNFKRKSKMDIMIPFFQGLKIIA